MVLTMDYGTYCEVRLTEPEDTEYLREWLSLENALQHFPMVEGVELSLAMRIWMEYVRKRAAYTAVYHGQVCGMCVLNLSPYVKTKHQCLISLIVHPEYRGRGIGRRLLEEMRDRGKEEFFFQEIHLEVYEGNQAKRLYERFGFVEIGTHRNFVCDVTKKNTFLDKIFMTMRL